MFDNHIKAKVVGRNIWIVGYYVQHEKVMPNGFGLSEQQFKEIYKNNIAHYIFYDGSSDWDLPQPLLQEEIEPETICRYAGFKDNTNQEVFENDVVEITDKSQPRREKNYYLISYNNKTQSFNMIDNAQWSMQHISPMKLEYLIADRKNIKVMGNVIQNKDKKEELFRLIENKISDYEKIELDKKGEKE